MQRFPIEKDFTSRHNVRVGGLLDMNENKYRGQGLIEYALILVLISIVVIVALTALGPAISNALYQNIITGI